MYEIFSRLLQENGVTAYKVSKETGVSQSSLSDWKLGKITPKTETLKKIADYFGVSVDYLLTGENGQNADLENGAYYLNDDAAKTAQEIFEKDKVLFDVYRSTDKDRLIAYAKKLRDLQKMEEGEEQGVYYKGYHINIVLLEKACGVPGSVHKNRDDSYTIFIDANLTYEKQHEVFLHELRHILGDDFDEKDVQKIELRNHMYDWDISKELCPVFDFKKLAAQSS